MPPPRSSKSPISDESHDDIKGFQPIAAWGAALELIAQRYWAMALLPPPPIPIVLRLPEPAHIGGARCVGVCAVLLGAVLIALFPQS